jgi:hypothetical protein
MTAFEAKLDRDSVTERLAEQERELERLREEVARWRAKAARLPTRDDADFTSI